MNATKPKPAPAAATDRPPPVPCSERCSFRLAPGVCNWTLREILGLGLCGPLAAGIARVNQAAFVEA